MDCCSRKCIRQTRRLGVGRSAQQGQPYKATTDSSGRSRRDAPVHEGDAVELVVAVLQGLEEEDELWRFELFDVERCVAQRLDVALYPPHEREAVDALEAFFRVYV